VPQVLGVAVESAAGNDGHLGRHLSTLGDHEPGGAGIGHGNDEGLCALNAGALKNFPARGVSNLREESGRARGGDALGIKVHDEHGCSQGLERVGHALPGRAEADYDDVSLEFLLRFPFPGPLRRGKAPRVQPALDAFRPGGSQGNEIGRQQQGHRGRRNKEPEALGPHDAVARGDHGEHE
jgi:hypothetical protein